MSEHERVLGLKKGNARSLAFLMEEYQRPLFHYAMGYVWSRELAEEIVSDVFVQLWAKRSTLEEGRSPKGLLYKVCHDLCIDHLRKTAKKEKLRNEFIANYLAANVHQAEKLEPESPQVEKAKTLIGELPKKCREVMKLRYEEGLSIAEISNRMHISKNTVQNHLVKGLKFIRKLMLFLPLLLSE